MKRSDKIPPQLCLSCGYAVDSATDAFETASPEPGDATMCLACGHFMIFDEHLRHREPTVAEQAKLDGDPRIARMRKARAEVMAKRAAPNPPKAN